MAKFLFVTCVFAAWALMFVNCEPLMSKAPAPEAVNCTTLIYKMTDCLAYLTKGGNETKPEPSCCSGYKTVVKTDVKCICEALKSSANLGLDIDMSKAVKLPHACGDKSTNLKTCFPHPPSHAPSKPPVKPTVPAPAPMKAAATTTTIPAFTLISLAIVPFFYIVA